MSLASISNEDLYPNLHRQAANSPPMAPTGCPSHDQCQAECKRRKELAEEARKRKQSDASDKSWDLYPGISREIINNGTEEQKRQLEEMEHSLGKK